MTARPKGELVHALRIGDVELPNNLMLSPMAGFSDLPFRLLCRRHGAGLVVSEMITATSWEHGDARMEQRATTVKAERPTSIQIASRDPEEAASAAREAGSRCDILGLNLGCPAWQVHRAGCGARLLDEPELCEALVEAIRAAGRRPLMVKMRAGNQGPVDIVSFARRMEAAGADALCLHGRTAEEGYRGRADWRLIGRVAAAVSVPFFGNGDITDGPSAERALRASGCDGLAIGRASRGDPRIFHRIAHYLGTGEAVAPPTLAERYEDVCAYLDLAVELGLHKQQVVQQAHQFSRGVRGAAGLRQAIHHRDVGPDDVRRAWHAFAAGRLTA